MTNTTTKTKAKTSDFDAIVDLKMKELMYYNENARMRMITGDCYQSLSQMKSCEKLMDSLKSDIAEHLNSGGSADDVQVYRKYELLESCEDQMIDYNLRHSVNLALCKDITGSEFSPAPQKRKAIPSARIKQILGS